MSMRFRRSVKLGPGVRLTASKSGLSVRGGPKGAGYSVSTTGRRTASVGIPGSGLYYTKSRTGSSRGRSGARQQAAAAPPSAIPKPGLFASGYEKAFARGVQLLVAGSEEQALAKFEEAAAKDESGKALADDLFAGLLAAKLGRESGAVAHLEKVVEAPDGLPDALMSKYIPGGMTGIGVTEHVAIEVEFGSLAAALSLAEIYQRTGRREEAIGLLQQLIGVVEHPGLTLSLAELLIEDGAFDEVVELLAGTRNEDDLTLQLCLFQARALEEQGMNDAALEVYREALRARKRNPELLKAARYGRGRRYLLGNKKAQGRKDLGRVYADDPDYRDVARLLEENSS